MSGILGSGGGRPQRPIGPRHPQWPALVNRAWQQGDIVHMSGMQIRVDSRLSRNMVGVLMAKQHTVQERRLALPILEDTDVVMELGGGIGTVAIACAQRIGGERVFTYEPNPNMEALMRENFELNYVNPTATFCMLAKEEGETPFHVSEHFRESSEVTKYGRTETIMVPVKSVNDEMRRIGATMLISDTQGSEVEMISYLEPGPLQKIVMEFHPELLGAAKARQVHEAILDWGFVEHERLGERYASYLRKSPETSDA